MFLDRIDKSILRYLQKDAAASNVKLASIIGLSPPACFKCFKRVKRLKNAGIIVSQVALLEQSKLATCLYIMVNIEMEKDRLELNNEFISQMKSAAEVKQCYQVTGEIDFVLLVTVQNMQDYEHFCQRYLYSHANMKNFKTHISMNRIKFDTSAVIPD